MHGAEIKLYRGSYCLYWREDGRARRQALGTKDRLEARKIAAELVEVGDKIEAPTWCISDLWERYRLKLEGKPAAVTMTFEAKSILPHFGHLMPAEINDEIVDAYTAKRRALGRSDGTILTELNRLACALSYAVAKDWIVKAPVIKRPQQPAPRDRYLTRDEARTFLSHVKAPHTHLFVVLALCTAARREALLGLTWDRVDLDRRRIDLREPSSRKLKGRAIVPLNDTAVAELEQAHAHASGDYVISWAGERVASVKTGLRQASRASKVRGVTAHVFRHTAAVWMAENGVRMDEIAQYLGHNDVKTTRKVYARFSPDYLRQAASALDF